MTDSRSKLQNLQLTGPFESLRDYVTALEARGRLLRIEEMDQDQFETTGFAIAWLKGSALSGHLLFLPNESRLMVVGLMVPSFPICLAATTPRRWGLVLKRLPKTNPKCSAAPLRFLLIVQMLTENGLVTSRHHRA